MEESDAIYFGFRAQCLARAAGPMAMAADSTEHGHTPGGSWKRPTTLFSGVLKKAAAIELYSPSAQKSCKVGREDGPVGWGSPAQHQAPTHGRMRSGCCLGGEAGCVSGSIPTAPTPQVLLGPCQATCWEEGRGRLQPDRHQLSRHPVGCLTLCEDTPACVAQGSGVPLCH